MRWIVRSSSGNHEVEVLRQPGGFEVLVDGQPRRVDLICLDGAVASLRFVDDCRSFEVCFQQGRGASWRLAVGEREFDLGVLSPLEAIQAEDSAAASGASRIEAPIPGKVVALKVKPGDRVEAGQALVVLEAMKMENELTAEQPGLVSQVHVQPGATVDGGSLLVELEPV